MTEKEFQRQVWRQYDTITTCDGIPGKVLQVAFNTKSVRAFISGAPEWVRCEMIETHTTGKGADGDDLATIEQLQNKLDFANQRVEVLKDEVKELEEKLARNYAGDLLKNVNVILNVCREKKARAEKMEGCMEQILQTLEKMNINNNEEL
jgi:hypothetical protein